MITKVDSFFYKHRTIIIIFILLGMLLLNAQGLAWGLPEFWNPDEIVYRVNLALDGLWKFDDINFDYPSLPKYVMFFLGKLTDALGYDRTTFVISARFLSVFLGILSAWIGYGIARQMGCKPSTAILALLLIGTNSELALNAHFAHNDLYSVFFSSLTIFTTAKFINSKNKTWLYISFFCAGLAASSKYIAGIIVLLPTLMALLMWGKETFKKFLPLFETLFIGTTLSILGFGLGTPKSLTWFSFYIKRLIPTLARQANYNRTPTSVPGLLQQWSMLRNSVLGTAVYFLFIISIIFVTAYLFFAFIKKIKLDPGQRINLVLILLSIFLLDLPIILSYNVENRYLLPMVVPISVLIAYFVEWLVKKLQALGKEKYIFLISLTIAVVLIFAIGSLISISLTFKNDARIAAGEFIKGLPADAKYEATWYSPNFPGSFKNTAEYPFVFLKYPDSEIPEDTYTPFNTGEEGVENRKPDYLIISSFVYDRFSDSYVCSRHPADCDFFRNLLSNKTNYKEIAKFSYSTPWYLPKTDLTFVNPQIHIYERIN